jgi:uncharacterized membrane protein
LCLGAAVLLAATILYFCFSGNPVIVKYRELVRFFSSRREVKAFLNSFGPYAPLVFIVLQALQVVLAPIPGEATGFLGGYVFGPRFGFLLGAGSLFVSAFAIGGVGPWMPFQIFVAGWVGMTAGWLGTLRKRLCRRRSLELAALAAFGVAWGFLFGAVMNLWFWPVMAVGEGISWQPGQSLGETLRHYWSFYLLTSAGWDIWRAAANLALIVALGRPVLNVLTRFHDRFQVELN